MAVIKKPEIMIKAYVFLFNENEILGNSIDPEKTYIEEVMPAKLELNKKYISNRTVKHDIEIMLLTFKKMFAR